MSRSAQLHWRGIYISSLAVRRSAEMHKDTGYRTCTRPGEVNQIRHPPPTWHSPLCVPFRSLLLHFASEHQHVPSEQLPAAMGNHKAEELIRYVSGTSIHRLELIRS